MRKLKFYIVAALAFALFLVASPMRENAFAAEKEYYVGGMTAGFLLGAGGAQVIGFNDVITEKGSFRPAEEGGLQAGDLIEKINGGKIGSIEDLNVALEKNGENEAIIELKRGNSRIELNVLPQKEKKSGKYKLGVLIRDTVSGIGTVTYIEKNTKRFGALGHAVSENDEEVKISDARVYLCSVIGVNKGSRGKAGELRGLFLNDKNVATAEKVTKVGLFGQYKRDSSLASRPLLSAGSLAEVTIGKAEIYSTIDGVTPEKYEICIVKVDEEQKENKNFVIKVTDERLIEETGGIVQGMSGSPIVQNGKLIGAVTHVFLNDPTRGYGIGIERMLENE